jgi:hypothetical protein
MDDANIHLASAFPTAFHPQAIDATRFLPEDKHSDRHGCYVMNVAGEQVSIPRRIYHDVSQVPLWRMWGTKKELLRALLTRHKSGFVRQRYLKLTLGVNEIWTPPFVMLLAGEYVVQILDMIWENRAHLDKNLYSQFLKANPELLSWTEQRITSYWDCYYRSHKKSEYAGFRLVEFFRSVADSPGQAARLE